MQGNMTREEKKLLRLILRHPDKGMELAIERYGDVVKTICCSMLREYGAEDVEDAMEECFVRIWQIALKPTGKIQSLQSYIYQTARNCAWDILRQKGKNQAWSLEKLEDMGDFMEPVAPEDTERQVMDRIQKEECLRVIHSFEEPDKSIFLMRFLYEYKVKDIAATTGLAEDNVESRIRRGRKKLQSILAGK